MADKRKGEQVKSKVLYILETIFYTVMSVGVLGILVMGAIRILGIVGAAVAFGVLVAVCILLNISIKKEDRQKEQYAEKYISQIILENEAFGAMRFEKDSHKNTLTCGERRFSFGNYHPIIELEGQGEEGEKEVFFRNLGYIQGRQEEIINKLLELLVDEGLASWEELQKRFAVERIRMQKYDVYLAGEDPLDGSPEDRILSVEGSSGIEDYPFVPMAYVNCSTHEIDYVLHD